MKQAACLAIALLLMAMASEAASVAKVDPRVVAANREFGLKLFKQFARESRGKNVVMSPASVSMALSMTLNGAAGSTKTAMADTLGYSNVSLDDINAGNRSLMRNLMQPGQGVEISIANSLWARRGVQLKPDFLNRNKEFYEAEIAALNFGSPDAADRINLWVNDKTRGKIKTIIDQIDQQAILFLVNAVYFNGKWTVPFDKKQTRDHDFTLGDGKVVQVPMMHRQGDFEYLQGDKFQFIKLDYGKDARLGMYILLPAEDSSLGDLYKQLTPANWNEWTGQAKARVTDVQLWLPRFKADYRTEAKDALSALGMKVAFDPMRADFTAMAQIPPSPNVYIGEVLHKAIVEVDEQGTVAAAATAVGAVVTAVPGPRPEPVRMVVDRPFIFVIQDDVTSELLFLGAITDPRS